MKWGDLTSQYLLELLKGNDIKTIFHLATIHGPSTEKDRFDNVVENFKINFNFTEMALNSIKKNSRDTGFIYAGSSLMFSCGSANEKISENSIPKPQNNYGHIKNTVFNLINFYREFEGIKASTHILFNNSSPRQQLNYLLPHLAIISHNIIGSYSKPIEIKNPSALLDIGDAREYAKTFTLASKQNFYHNVIVGRGEFNSVIEIFLKFLLSSDFKMTKDLENKLITWILSFENSDTEYCLFANIEKIKYELNWVPKITISRTIADILYANNLENFYRPEFTNLNLLEILVKAKFQNPSLNFIADLDNAS